MADSDSNEVPPQLNPYARPFIPAVLKAVNDAPANIVPAEPAPWIDFDAYVRTFSGSDFSSAEKAPNSDPHVSLTNLSQARSFSSTANDAAGANEEAFGSVASTSPTQSDDNDSVPDEEISKSNLNRAKYSKYFAAAMKSELNALRKECKEHALYQVRLYINNMTPLSTDLGPCIYCLSVPGLREMSLRIEVGDIVELRQIRFDQNGKIIYGTITQDRDGKNVKFRNLGEIQHSSVVWAIDRLNEMLFLRADNLVGHSWMFNVQFTVQSSRFGAMCKAGALAQQRLDISDENWTRRMLFPEPSDGQYQISLNKATINLDFNDAQLDFEQKRAVHTVLEKKYGAMPYLISGPPGTGKTKTLVELALQLIAKDENAHLLVCAPSDPAADILVERLKEHLSPKQLFRLNSPSRSFPETPNTILPYCCVHDSMFYLLPFKRLMQVRILVTTSSDAEILCRARLTNRDLWELEKSVYTTIHPNRESLQRHLHWTGLLMDEAAQATELEASIPLNVVAPPDDYPPAENGKISPIPIVVMAGDQHQLGPRTASRSTAMRKSLFERLLERPCYAEHTLARSKQSGGIMQRLTQDMLPIFRPPFTNLIRNYRSHTAILATSSMLFYNDTLEPEATDMDTLLRCRYWRPSNGNLRARLWPVAFVANTSMDEIEKDGGGWFNIGEARKACQWAHNFVNDGYLRPGEICIMSPFRAQVRLIRKLIKEPPFSLTGVNIGPLEAFQGLQSSLVIVCTTRTRDRFIDQDVERGYGIIHEPKKFNVALTRARHGLVVIGNPEVLAQDTNWQEFMSFCSRHRLWAKGEKTSWQPHNWKTSRWSRLEKQLVRQDADPNIYRITSDSLGEAILFGRADDDDSLLWHSGIAAALLTPTDEEEVQEGEEENEEADNGGEGNEEEEELDSSDDELHDFSHLNIVYY